MSLDGARVFVVDDDEDVRQALARRIRAAGYAVETFASAHEFLARLPHDGLACVLLDLRMPGVDGLELQEALARARATTPVVFLSGHADVPSSVQAMQGGAVDFLLKPAEEDRLLDSLARAIDRHAAARAAEAERAAIRARWSRLTRREREVAVLVAEGKLNKQIAADLGAAEKTIKIHRARVVRKLQVGSVAELVRFVDRLAGCP